LNIDLSADKGKIDLDFVHGFLSEESYWAKGRSKEQVQRTIDNSFCVAAYQDGNQIGFGRAVTDFQSFAYIMDVFVTPSMKGSGIGKKIMDALINSNELRHINKFTLATAQAASFYSKMGFKPSQSNYLVLVRKNS